MRVPLVSLLLLGSVSILPLPTFAQGDAPVASASAAQVQVLAVKSDYVRAPDGQNWLEFAVELDVRPGGRAVSGEFVDRVGVSLGLMTEVGGDKRKVFYRSQSEFVSMEGGRHVARFYLPPEVVKRDRLRPQVDFYAVNLEVGGRPQPASESAASKNFSGPESVKKFNSHLASEGGPNDGVLMPQYLTPFSGDSRRPSPTYLRREVLR